MATMRKGLRLLPDEKEALQELYKHFGIPTDQYPQRSEDLVRLVESWNALTGRKESPADVLHYMVTRRKKGEWVRLGRDCDKLTSETTIEFSKDELQCLDAIHEELQIASDNYALNAELAQKLQQEFARRTGRIIPPMILAAAMINRRKAGALATLRPRTDDGDMGFSDINQVS